LKNSIRTRFHFVLLVALIVALIAVTLRSFLIGAIAICGLLAVIGLGVVFPQIRLFGPFVCRGSRDVKRVALTFDDGPDECSTPQLLELLGERRVKATFFAVGKRVAAHPEIAARIVREGHLLENHSYSHSNATNFFSVSRLRTELDQAQEAIRRATGVAPTCFRPPMGLSNPRIFRAAREAGLKVIGWSARGLDTKLTDSQEVVSRICRRLEPGAIILLHDGNIPADRLVTTVKTLLDRLRALDYEIVRLDHLLNSN
jgi:peptidoglycan/xylan/chitin deacetylase (PgdA/CDA1 family)